MTPAAWLKVFTVLLLLTTGVTWAVGLLDFQYKDGNHITFQNGFPGDIEQWERAGGWENVDLRSDSVGIRRVSDKLSYAVLTVPLPAYEQIKNQNLRVRGIIKTVTRGDPVELEREAAYMIWLLDQAKEPLDYLTVQHLTGDFDEYFAERIIGIPEDARFITLALVSRDTNSEFDLIDASVRLVTTTNLYRAASYVIIILWVLLMLMTILWVIARASIWITLSSCALILIIMTGVVLPESVTSGVVLPVYRILSTLLPFENTAPVSVIYKAGHFLFFLLTEFILILNRVSLQVSASLLLFLLVVLAVATEGLQLHLFNRSTRIADVGIDILGIILGYLLAMLLSRSHNNISKPDIAP